MVDTFKWNVEREVDPTIEFRTISAQFGDGYVQESADGINTKTEQYTIKVNAYEKKAKEIMAFFNKHQGIKSFYWTPPLGTLGLYRCKNPKPTPQGGGLYVITATFVKAFAA